MGFALCFCNTKAKLAIKQNNKKLKAKYMKVNFYESVSDELLKFAVIIIF